MTSLLSFASIQAGIATLRTYPGRTVLSTLGIIIGVASLVAVLALGDGIERFARAEIERTTSVQSVIVSPLTSDVIEGTRFPRNDVLVFTVQDAGQLGKELDSVAAVTLRISGGALLSDSGRSRRAAMIVGTLPNLVELTPISLPAGRFFTGAESDQSLPPAVISQQLARDLVGQGPLSEAVGRSILLQGRAARVVGVLGENDGQGRIVYLPIGVAEAFMAPSSLVRAPDIIIKAERIEDVRAVEQRVTTWLNRRDPGWRDRATVQTSGARVRQAEQGMLIFKLTMGAITGISLIVGGIGIMNVLLASVVERTREIGVRKAIGARQRDIMVQFLAESVTVSGIGSLVGVGLGLAGAFGITALIRARSAATVYAAFSWTTVLIAALAALVVGLLFGIYPALRAARLSPIDAIRHE
jgi:putative ABC transport system permease protein